MLAGGRYVTVWSAVRPELFLEFLKLSVSEEPNKVIMVGT